MMRSPEQQFALAKSLPIPELAKVLQGQSDVVDMAIAQMVLRQKVQTQTAQQGMAAQQVAQSPKVRETDLAKAAQISQPRMEQGVAGMPVGGIGEIGNYTGAAGGIVAFDNGGVASIGAPLQSTRVPGPGPTFASTFGNTARTASRIPGMFGRMGMALSPMLAVSSMVDPFGEDEARLREFDRAKAVLKEAGFTDKDIDALKSQDVYRMATGYGYKPATPTAAKAAGTPSAPAAPTAPTPNAAAAGPSPEEAGLGALTGQVAALRNRLTKPTMETSAREVEEMYGKAGVSMDPYAQYKTALEAEKAQNAEDRRQAGWGRLLEAGLGILGGESPYALTNIGKGSQAAAKGAMEDIKEFSKLERDRNKALASIAVAENDLKRGVTDKKIARYDEAVKDYNAKDFKLSELELGIKLEQAKIAISKGAKREEVALKEANDQIQKEMVTDPFLARDPVKYKQRFNALYTDFLSALSGKGLSTQATAVPAGVKVTREKN